MWENLVTACTKCNSKKGSKSLKQLGWKLKNKPKASDLPVALLDDLEVLYAEKATLNPKYRQDGSPDKQ